MEDGPNGVLSEVEELVKNGVENPIMANFPESEEAATHNNLINGDSEQVSNPESCSSESDALVIDENVPKRNEIIPHFNPYFNESLFELSQQHTTHPVKSHKHKRLKAKNSPKLREYAQYLGLQPTVQFKCSRCGRAGFESLTTLNEHIIQCTDEPLSEPQVQDSSSSSFKLRRKVFLCSACGTYYENWNLYLHMIEVHRRYLCLYCLGMFSVLDDLCLHIQSRHNFEPGYKDSLEDFFSTYSEPCYIVCCECNKLFNEQDNFFYHTCARKDKKIANNQKVNNKIAKNKPQIRPEDHVTGDSSHQECRHINGDVNDPSIIANDNDKIDKITEEISFEKQQSLIKEEIIYSSDDELDFKGFNENGEPVFTDQLKGFENTEEEAINMDEIEPVETRKVPKLSLKLKPGSFPEIEHHDFVSDEEKHDENEQIESETENEINTTEERSEEVLPETQEEVEGEEEEEIVHSTENEMKIAGSDINIIELELEQPLDKFDIRVLLQKCLKATAPICIYCNHARKIAVNGKHLGLHAIAEHRFSAVVSSITAEELIPESFVTRIKESLVELENVFFSLEASTSDEGVTFSHVFECFQCRYSTTVHKELYLHNRKLHAKNLLLCIMCKSNFYSYSELICHLCPGVYVLDCDVEFRCCMCVSDNLPSAFRLMVHLRKRHHVCDVCLEMCHNQYKLSNHVWKHKLHHFCYRCGIAYRNKPDITRHLFWKHGTESVLCKKCLQKKWPHVYHFCVPPTSFVCEECNLTFSRAVFLKVHKRIHSDEKPHACTIEGCEEKFISKKLLEKHEYKHREPPEEEKLEVQEPVEEVRTEEIQVEEKQEKIEEKVKPKVDVYDLPALNLSESDSSDSENEGTTEKETKEANYRDEQGQDQNLPKSDNQEEHETPLQVVESENLQTDNNDVVIENIWDNFKNYQANKEKFDHMFEVDKNDHTEEPQSTVEEPVLTLELALKDHDYCIDPDNKTDVTFTEVKPDLSQSVDHDYCFAKDPETAAPEETEKKKIEDEKEKKNESSSSDSSSDSDSSSCSCGPNCSCSSSSNSSSSSSDSSDSDSSTEEGRKRQQIRREKRRQKKNNDKGKTKIDVVNNDQQTIPLETPLVESDLETTESETDEEFYDKQPQIFAKKILEEKRNQLLAGIDQIPNGSLENRASTPNLPDEEVKPKKKSKSKKKKKKKSERKELGVENKRFEDIPAPYYQYYQPPPTVAPITLTLSRNSPIPSPSTAKLPPANLYGKSDIDNSRDEGDTSLRASKRRRVPNKFYGYSSDEEDEKIAPQKWRKTEPVIPPQQQQPMVVPPITIKTASPVQPFSIRNMSGGQLKVQAPPRRMPTIKLKPPKPEELESEVESNDSSNESRNMLQVDPNALYCYCKCPYDEVSEMIGCDSRDCSIEWFHFECVGIMVPPKGHWYCPECRKKRQQKREMLKLKAKTTNA